MRGIDSTCAQKVLLITARPVPPAGKRKLHSAHTMVAMHSVLRFTYTQDLMIHVPGSEHPFADYLLSTLGSGAPRLKILYSRVLLGPI